MRIPWIALCAAGATVTALAAPALSADARNGSTGTYTISLTGSQRSVVTRTGTTTDDLGCTIRHADRDVRAITFASQRRSALDLSNGLPFIRFELSARVSGSFHRETRIAGGGDDCVSAPKTDRTCGPARLRAGLAVRPVGGLRVRLDGGFVRIRDRNRCATTLVAPDRFIVPTGSSLKRSPAGAERVFVRGRLVQQTTAPGRVTKTTTVDWTLVLTRSR